MGASESSNRTPEWINRPNGSERTSNSSSEEENTGNGSGSTASKILTAAGVAIGAVALGGTLAYALSSSSASTSEYPNHYSQPFSSSSSSSPSFSGASPSNRHVPNKQILNLPEENLIKCNVDGSFRYVHGSSSKGRAGCGGVFRDASGAWIHGFSRNLGVFEITEPGLWGTFIMKAELSGILTALSIAWDKGFRNVIVMSDSEASVQMIKEGCKEKPEFYDLIQGIQSLLERPWKPDFEFVPREKNKAADTMAGFSYQMKEGLNEFIDPPEGMERVLKDDLAAG